MRSAAQSPAAPLQPPPLPALLLVTAMTAAVLASSAHARVAARDPEDAPPGPPVDAPVDARQLAASERRLSAQIRALLAHYQQEDPVGLPGAPVPDPLPVPDNTRSLPMATVTVHDALVHGLSRFRVDRAMLDLANLSAAIDIRLERVEIEGSYSIRYFLTNSKGRINITLEQLSVSALAALAIAGDGRVRADDVSLDVKFSDMRVRIQNEALSSFMRSVLESMAPLLYDSIKPFVLSEAQHKVRGELDARCSKLTQRFPNSLSPLDLLVWDARKLVAHMGFDPYPVPGYNYSTGLTTFSLSNVWLSGLSSFHRAGAARVGFEKHVFRAALRVATTRLAGQCHWRMDFAGLLGRGGHAHFSVEYLEALVMLSQPLDTRRRPQLERLDVSLGGFAVRVGGAGTLDYAAEALANLLPNLLRAHIRNALQRKVSEGVRSALARIDVQALVEERLEELDEVQKAAEEMDAEADIFESLG